MTIIDDQINWVPNANITATKISLNDIVLNFLSRPETVVGLTDAEVDRGECDCSVDEYEAIISVDEQRTEATEEFICNLYFTGTKQWMKVPTL